MDGLQLSRTSATFITFLLSACCHELVMAVVSKKIRPYLFLMQVSLSSYTLSVPLHPFDFLGGGGASESLLSVLELGS